MAAATFFCAPPTAVFASPTVSLTLPSAFNLSLPVRSPTACLTLPLAWSIFPSRSFLFHMTCSNRWLAFRRSPEQHAVDRQRASVQFGTPQVAGQGVEVRPVRRARLLRVLPIADRQSLAVNGVRLRMTAHAGRRRWENSELRRDSFRYLLRKTTRPDGMGCEVEIPAGSIAVGLVE